MQNFNIELIECTTNFIRSDDNLLVLFLCAVFSSMYRMLSAKLDDRQQCLGCECRAANSTCQLLSIATLSSEMTSPF